MLSTVMSGKKQFPPIVFCIPCPLWFVICETVYLTEHKYLVAMRNKLLKSWSQFTPKFSLFRLIFFFFKPFKFWKQDCIGFQAFGQPHTQPLGQRGSGGFHGELLCIAERQHFQKCRGENFELVLNDNNFSYFPKYPTSWIYVFGK